MGLLTLALVLLAALLTLGNILSVRGNVGEDGETGSLRHGDVEGRDVRVLNLCDALFHDLGVLVQEVLEWSLLRVEVAEVSLQVAELAPLSVDADVRSLKIRLAQGHAELGGNVSLLDKLFFTVSESAGVTEVAVFTSKPELAKLSLLLLFVRGLLDDWGAGGGALRHGRSE